MPRPADSRAAGRLPRFTRAETWVHRTTAVLVAVLFVTGAVLYVPSLSVLVARRVVVEGTHIAAGLALPLPMLIGLGRSPALRADVRALGRLLPVDLQWLRRRDRRTARLPVGKFNGGQKLAAAVMAGSGLVLLGTGLLLIAPAFVDVPDAIRTGATITHDLFTFGLLLLLGGHVWLAMRHPEARAALRSGAMDRDYARREHLGWVSAVEDEAAPIG